MLPATKIFLERELYNGVIYPESDGEPMAENTVQYHWLTTIKANLDAMFAEAPHVFVAGDLFWYPVEGHPEIRYAPDVMVIFGRPKAHRGSYMQFREQNIAPQVVFEILSPGNTPAEMTRKHQFYERYGVEEYYVYDPAHEQLEGWLRQGDLLTLIEAIQNWVSPRLGMRFVMSKTGLQLYRADGTPFLTYVELEETYRQEQFQSIFAEDRASQAEAKQSIAEEQKMAAEEQKMAAEARAKQAETQAARYASRLRALGLDPDAGELT